MLPNSRSYSCPCPALPPLTPGLAPPKLASLAAPQQQLQQDQRVSVLCSVTDGEEPVVVTWWKDGQALQPSQESGVDITEIDHDSILRIGRLEGRHMGNYSCRAENEAGSAVVYSFIQVMGTSSTF